MLLTGGRHPLYRSGDGADEYKRKLEKTDKFAFPSDLSALARNFFFRLTKFQSYKRYSATEALKHPWITRRNETKIPLTMPELMGNYELEGNLKQKVVLSLFLSVVSQSNKSLAEREVEKEKNNQYKRLLDKVSSKIDKWYSEVQTQKVGVFRRDDEFIEIEHSPTKFDTDSEEDSPDEELKIEESPEMRDFQSKRQSDQTNNMSFSLNLFQTGGGGAT